MKNKKYLIISILLISFSKLFAQNSNLEQIAEAILQIEAQGKVSKCKTDTNGNFAISFSDESNFINNKIDANIKIVSSGSKNYSANNIVKTTLIKNENLYYEFLLRYNNHQRKFIITPQNDNNIKKNGDKIKRGKGDASKSGDKYMGQVAHF